MRFFGAINRGRIVRFLRAAGLGALAVFAGCAPVQIRVMVDATPTEIVLVPATHAPSPSPSIVWFPPTATPLPLFTPTAVPTEDRLGELGAPYVADGFAPENGWATRRGPGGNVTLTDGGELTLSMPGEAARLVALNKIPAYRRYYLSVDVTLSFCSYFQDEYGILFRVETVERSEQSAQLRFNCLGQTQFLRSSGGKLSPLSDWAANGKIRPGAPQKFTVGLRVDGESVELYLNGVFQYEISDPSSGSGGIALLAETSGVAPLTVSFSNLSIVRLR